MVIFLASLNTFNANAYEPWSNKPSYAINSTQQAARKVKAVVGGKVLKVRSIKINRDPGYKVKVLKDNGHVISVKINAKTGRILKE